MLSIDITFVRFYSAVYSVIDIITAFMWKGFSTNVALEWFLSRMYSALFVQISVIVGYFTADLAFVKRFSGV